MAQKSVLQPLNPNTVNNRLSIGRPSRKSTSGPPARLSLAPASNRKSSIGSSNSRASLAPRQSGVGVKSLRTSTAFGKGDPRPITDKSFITSSIRTLITYLTSHNYDHEISPKILSSPTGRDFVNIVSFLGRQLDPSFTITKQEEDIPNLFKNFRYPFQISKKGLSSVGAPHTWPAMLAALVWLVDLLNSVESFDNGATFHGFDAYTLEEDMDSEKLFFEFNVKAYADFLDGLDDFAQLESDLTSIFESRNESIKRDNETYLAMKQQMLREIDEYTNGPNRVESLTLQKQTFLSDVQKFKTLVANLTSHKQTLEKKIKELQSEFETKQQEIESAQKEKVQLTEIVQNQDISIVDVERMNTEKSTLEEQLMSVGNQKDSIEKIIFEKEIQISKKLEDVEREIQSFNNMARKLQLIPTNSKYAKGVNYQLHLNTQAPESVVETLKSTIKPSLDDLKVQFSKSVIASKEEILTLKEKIDRCEESISDKKEEIGIVESKTTKVENSYKKEKERLKDQLKQKQLEIDNLHKDINRMKDNSAESLALSNKSVESLRIEYEELFHKCGVEKEEINNCIIQILDMLASHKAYVQENLAALHKYYTQVKSTFATTKQ